MEEFQEINTKQWDEGVKQKSGTSVFMLSQWEEALSLELPFVKFLHYRYRDTHLVRVTEIDGRYTTAPFSEGSDVVSLSQTTFDLKQFQIDLRAQFGESVRLRVNERFAPLTEGDEADIVAYEYVVDSSEPVLPKVRKTLRHILQKPSVGEIKQQTRNKSTEAAYKLYLRHMRNVKNFALPKKLFNSLIAKSGGELWTWSSGNSLGAMAIFLDNGEEGLYSLSAANAKALIAQAPHHLVYQALDKFRVKGVKRVSLGATGKGSALEVFKRGWRGEQYAIYEIGERSGVSRTSGARSLVKYVPLLLYPLITKILGKRFL